MPDWHRFKSGDPLIVSRVALYAKRTAENTAPTPK